MGKITAHIYRRHMDGDQAAFAELVHRLEPRLEASLHSSKMDSHDRVEAVQRAFSKLWWTAGVEPDAVTRWTFRALEREMLMAQRAARRRRRREVPFACDPSSEDDPSASVPDQGAGPDALAELSEEGERARALVAGLLGRLDEQTAEVIRLRHMSEMSFLAIAERLGLTEANARKRHERAIQRLARLAASECAAPANGRAA